MKTWRIKIMEFQMKKNQKKDEAEEEKKRRMRLRGELPPEEEEEEEDWDPECIRSILPYKGLEGEQQFIVSSQGQFNGFVYICSLDNVRPLKAIPIPEGKLVSFMKESKTSSGHIIAIGYDDGSIEYIVDSNFDRRMTIKNHDAHFGPVRSLCFNKDETFVMTVADDGLLYLYQFDKMCCIQDSKYDPLQGVEGAQFMPSEEKEELKIKKTKQHQIDNPAVYPEVNELEMALDEASLSITLKLKEPTGKDVEDPTIYSIQESKLRTEEDHRLTLAEKKKQGVRVQIDELRKEFEKIVEKNNNNSAHLQIGEDDFQIDPEFFNIL